MDKKVELGLADNTMTADLFCHVFKPVQVDIALPKDPRSGDNAKVHEAAVIQREKPRELSSWQKSLLATCRS